MLAEDAGVHSERKAELTQEYHDQQLENMRIARLEAEASEKLGDVYQKLLHAGVDKTQSKKEAKLKETLMSLQ